MIRFITELIVKMISLLPIKKNSDKLKILLVIEFRNSQRGNNQDIDLDLLRRVCKTNDVYRNILILNITESKKRFYRSKGKMITSYKI